MRKRLAGGLFVLCLLSAGSALGQALWTPDNSGGKYRGCALTVNGRHGATYIRVSWGTCMFYMFLTAPTAVPAVSQSDVRTAISKLPLDNEAEFRKQFEAARREMQTAFADAGVAAKEIDRISRMTPERARTLVFSHKP